MENADIVLGMNTGVKFGLDPKVLNGKKTDVRSLQ